MCGISGEFRRDGSPVDQSDLRAMATSMVHRGPDSDGFCVDGAIGFGFRRLAIVDLDGGDQPLLTEDGSVWMQGNGEIYNHLELRAELIALGHRFRTRSDMEVVLHGYRQWGTEIISRLNGIFAVAIWDAGAERLVLARDHLGVKPLYLHDDGRRLRFGSEIRALLADGTIRRELDDDSVRLFFHFGYLPAPTTLLRGVRKLRPGHLISATRSSVSEHRYWHPGEMADPDLDVDEAIERYGHLVTEAVERQMMSDVPVGMLLSGGVDSALVLAQATPVADGAMPSFTVGFDAAFEHDEGAYAAQTAARFGTEHHQIDVNLASFVDVFERTLWSLEEPVLSQSTFAFHLLTAEVAKHVKVVLTGQGADELWAGYDRYLGERYGARARWLFGSGAAAALSRRMPSAARLGRAVESLGESDPVRRFAAMHQVFSPDHIAGAAQGGLRRAAARAEDVIAYWQRPVADRDEFSQLLHVDARMSLADDLLFYGDKLSMANSVEARVPLLDLELVSFVESLPPNLKLRGRTGKYGHKRAAEALLPSEIVHRPKLGFATPVDRWFANDLTAVVRRAVLADDSWCRRHLSSSFLQSLIDEHAAGRRNNRRQLTALLSFEVVCRQLLDGAEPGHLTESTQELSMSTPSRAAGTAS
ncbi:MAG: asparagine synthase (glutamine-hydrolyzing) [Actinomycetota bacterium]